MEQEQKEKIDNEVKKIMDNAMKKAIDLVKKYRKKLKEVNQRVM